MNEQARQAAEDVYREDTLATYEKRAFVLGASWQAHQPIEITDEMVERAAEALEPGIFTLDDIAYARKFDNPVRNRSWHQLEAITDSRAALEAALGGRQ